MFWPALKLLFYHYYGPRDRQGVRRERERERERERREREGREECRGRKIRGGREQGKETERKC